MSIFSKIFGDPNEREIKKLQPMIEKINSLEPEIKKFSIQTIKEKTAEFKERLRKGENLDDLLPEAFALVRETAKKTLNQRHFDVQLIGGIVLHQGKISEMKTGEGKTLAATLALYLNALEEKGAHLVTVNDYLAKRDTVWMGQIYHALGLSVGCIAHDTAYLYDPTYRSEISNSNSQVPNGERDEERDLVGGFKVVESYLRPVSRKEAYSADIIYGTNNEFGFDYLRDNMAYDISRMVQVRDAKAKNGLHYAIVDEMDSILIDEARTPLIISAPAEEATEKYYEFTKLIGPLKKDTDYNMDEKMKSPTFTEEGQDKIVRNLGYDPWAENDIASTHQLEAALRAKTLFRRDKEYIVKDGKIIIIDEFTGRLMPGRRWSGGLHQAVEAKEGMKVRQESKTLATITFQNYFRMYKKLAGMTGTAVTSAEEFDKVYKLEVIVVPTNKPMVRKGLPDSIYRTEKGKFMAVVREIRKLSQKNRPVLVGTRSVEKNEYLGKLLEREGIPHQILNAKNHEKEGEIIAQAGKLGAVTIATNMAGRGVDIVLGGNPSEPQEVKKVIELGGLHIIGTERHEARRIDNQLRGRSGRQGDPGSSQFFISLEDELMRIFGGDKIKSLMEMLRIPEDQPIEAKLVSGTIESAQSKIEGFNFDARKHLLEYDDVINKHREIIYKKRREFLKEKDLKEEFLLIIEKEIKKIVEFNCSGNYSKEWNIEEIFEQIKTIFSVEDSTHTKLKEVVLDEGLSVITQKEEILNYLVNLGKNAYENKEKEIGSEDMRKIERAVSLKNLDLLWVDHLSNMEHLRDSVGLRAYGGQDPLVEYKSEGHRMFKNLLQILDASIVNTIFKVGLTEPTTQIYTDKNTDEHGLNQRKSTLPAQIFKENLGGQVSSNQRVKHKFGRNDPCPCGKINLQTGKPMKYKKCCYPKYG